MVKSPGSTYTFPQRKAATFPETGLPMDRHSIRKEALFDLLTADIIHIIFIWIVRLEHRDNLKAVVTQINSPCNTVLCVDANQVC